MQQGSRSFTKKAFMPDLVPYQEQSSKFMSTCFKKNSNLWESKASSQWHQARIKMIITKPARLYLGRDIPLSKFK